MKEPVRIRSLYQKLLASKKHVFPNKGRIQLTSNHGVYIVYNNRNKILHVGKTDRGKNGLNQRLNNHLYNQSSFSRKFITPNNLNLRSGYSIVYIEISNPRRRTLVEKLALGTLCPAHIGTGEKRGD